MEWVPVHRAGSEPYRPGAGASSQFQPAYPGVTWDGARQNDIWGPCGKPDPHRVMLQAMKPGGNPFVQLIAGAPARLAAGIQLYPVHGLKHGEPRRADPQGTLQERVAWDVHCMYRDDCRSLPNLVNRHFEAKMATGVGVQVSYLHEGRVVYELLQPSAITGKEGAYKWERSPGDVVDLIDANRVWNKSFEHPHVANSPLMAIVDLLALWELCRMALGDGVTSSMMRGIVYGPYDPNDKNDWRGDYKRQAEIMAKKGLSRDAVAVAIPNGYGDLGFLDISGDVQEMVLKLEEAIVKRIAMLTPMDAGMLLDGIGSMSHWNAIIAQRDNASSFLWPTLRLDVLEDIAAWPFRPLLEASGVEFDLDDWGLWGDWEAIVVNPDIGKTAYTGVREGILRPKTLTRVGFDLDEIMDPELYPDDWETFRDRVQITGKSVDDDRDREEQQVGPGGETFGDAPDTAVDTIETPEQATAWTLPEFV